MTNETNVDWNMVDSIANRAAAAIATASRQPTPQCDIHGCTQYASSRLTDNVIMTLPACASHAWEWVHNARVREHLVVVACAPNSDGKCAAAKWLADALLSYVDTGTLSTT